MLALAAATTLRPERSFALVTSRSLYPAPYLNAGADGLGAVEAQVVVLDLAVVVLGVRGPVVIVVVDALEERRERLLLRGRHAVDAHADDRSLVDLAEVEAERGRVAERRRGPEQVLLLRDPDHEIVGVEALRMLGRAVGVEVGRVDQVIAGRLVADGQGEVARRAALGGAVADQQLHVVRVLSQDVRDLVDVGGLRPALGSEVGGRRIGGEHEHRREPQRARGGREANNLGRFWTGHLGKIIAIRTSRRSKPTKTWSFDPGLNQ